jgi:hypothetical protein
MRRQWATCIEIGRIVGNSLEWKYTKIYMANDEILSLGSSVINGITIFLSWEVVSGADPTLNKYYTVYYNSNTITSTTMNVALELNPYTTYSIYVTSTNLSDEESVPSNTVTVTTTNISNFAGALASGPRPYPPDATNVTVENMYQITPVSNASSSTTPVFIDPTKKPFYQYYRIDPKGELFGSTPCGYRNFMKLTTTL